MGVRKEDAHPPMYDLSPCQMYGSVYAIFPRSVITPWVLYV